MKRLPLLILLGVLAAGPLAAQSIEFSGQLRERSEFDDKNFIEDQHHDVFHLLRMRLKATATVNEQVRVVAELQDARGFGANGSTMNVGAPAFDLRQGYVEVKGLADGLFEFRLGRQALAYANERFIGAIDWSNLGQSFDAGVLRMNVGDFRLDAIGAAVARRPASPYIRDRVLAGAWAAWVPEKARYTAQAFFLYDNPEEATYTYNSTQNRMTAGVYAGGHLGRFDYEVDAAMQMGDRTLVSEFASLSQDISANMVGVRLGYSFPDLAKLRIGAGYDRLSGVDPKDDTKYGAFHTLYGTNHKYYGFMDFFTDIPSHTSGFGLQDIIAQVSLVPVEGLMLGADVHLFSTVTDPADAGSVFADKSTAIGTEIDLTAKFAIAKAVGMTLGYSMFSGDADRAVRWGNTDTANWAYLMATVNF